MLKMMRAYLPASNKFPLGNHSPHYIGRLPVLSAAVLTLTASNSGATFDDVNISLSAGMIFVTISSLTMMYF
jgi:hypothetical protein